MGGGGFRTASRINEDWGTWCEGRPETNTANIPYLVSWFTVLFLLTLGIYYYSKWKSSQLQLENVQLDILNHEPDPFLTNLENYIRQHISTVTVANLSEFSGLTERALYRFLQDNYQMTPGDLIRNIKTQRMNEIIQENPDISRKELARELGYSLSSVFRILSELK
jgi:AraC-like DNA-binding protein